MATASLGGSISGKQTIICGVCLQCYVQPRTLPCGHTFCLKCLRRLATDYPQTSAPDDKESQLRGTLTGSFSVEWSPFVCPTCRRSVTVPPGGVDEFEADFTAEAEVARQTSTTILCDTCQAEAETACHDCQKRLCPKCRHIHNQFSGTAFHAFNDLRMKTVAGKKSSTSASSRRSHSREGLKCKTHAAEIVVFCRQCNVAACLQCQKRSHADHACEDLTTATEQMKKEVRTLLQKTQNEMESVDKVIDEKNQAVQELARQGEEMVRQTVEAASKVTAWVKDAEDKAVAQVNAISAPIRKKLQQQKDAALERKTSLTQLRDRARLTTESGSFVELKAVREQMEESLSAHPCSGDSQSVPWRNPADMLFKRLSSGKEILQNTVPRFVGEVTSSEEDGHKQLDTECAWGFHVTGIFRQYGLKAFTNSSANSLTLVLPNGSGMEFRTGERMVSEFVSSFPYHQAAATSLPSSDVLVLINEAFYIGPDYRHLSKVALPLPFSTNPFPLLSHDSMPQGRHAYMCLNKSPGVYEIQELAFNPPQDLAAVSLFQIVCKGPLSFDVSSDANHFAVLDLLQFNEHKSTFAVVQVSVFERMKAEPCAVFRSNKTVMQHDAFHPGDVCFSSYKGKEMLRVAAYFEDTVYTLDFKNDMAIMGRTPLNRPMYVRADAVGRIWVVCENHVVAFNSA